MGLSFEGRRLAGAYGLDCEIYASSFVESLVIPALEELLAGALDADALTCAPCAGGCESGRVCLER